MDTTTTEPIVEIDGLVKRYGDATVIDRISFDVRAGELFGLLGTNGAGKTTTVEILQGLRRADDGRVRVLGLDPARDGDRLRRMIGSQLQDSSLPGRMRVGEALEFFAALHPDPVPTDELADEWQLTHLRKRPFDGLSGGERQRLFVALALVGRPQLVFLDELTQNLDPAARRLTWDVVRRVRERGSTVVLVTHDVEEAERLCDRVVVMHHGAIVAEGPPATVGVADGELATVLFTDADISLDPLRDLPGVEDVERRGQLVRVRGTGPVLAHVGAHVTGVGRPPLDLRIHRPGLEDRFVALTSQELVS